MPKVRYLDGLRGCAAFVVVLHHFAAAFYPAAYLGLDLPRHSFLEPLLLTTPLGILMAGNFSVCIFFILSGFVLTRSFFGSGDERSLTSLAFRRYFRLLPPVLFSELVAWALLSAGLFPVREAAALSGSSRWLSQCWAFAPSLPGVLNESFFGVFLSHQNGYNNVLWTMTYEFIGSFLVFAVAALFGKNRSRAVVYAVLALLLYRTYYVAFLIGVVLSDVSCNRPDWFRKLDRAPVTVLLMAVGLYLGAFPPFMDIDSAWYNWLKFGYIWDIAPMFYHVLGALFLMTAVLSSSGLQAFFSSRPAAFLGKISFSLYAIHVILIGSLSCSLFIALAKSMPYNAAGIITLAVTVGASLALATVVNHFIDEPGIRLSKKIQCRLFPTD